MAETTSYGMGQNIRVHLDADILHELIYGVDGIAPGSDEQSKTNYHRNCILREHQVYRLMRSLVSQFNSRLKGRRERFKLVEEGDGLVMELSV